MAKSSDIKVSKYVRCKSTKGKDPLEEMERRFFYNPKTGQLFNKINNNPRALKDTEVGLYKHNGGGGRCVQVLGKRYMVHNICWFLYHGKWPKKYLDHIDGNPYNNKIDNLRECTHLQNMWNSKKKKGESYSKYKGVTFCKNTNKWVARIRIGHKRLNLKYHSNEHDAARAYNKAAKKYHGEFARLNEIDDEKEKSTD